MNWIKNRYDQLILAGVAIALLVFAGMVMTSTGSFEDRFSEVTKRTPERALTDSTLFPDPLPPASLTAPPKWEVPTDPDSERGLMFVSRHYIVQNGELKKVDGKGSVRNHSRTGEPIPDQWFIDYKLPYLQGNVTLQDPDKDGFTNEDEWREGTDPNDRNSHPPYHTKLFFKQVIRGPLFQIKFASWDGDLNKPETLQFQINTPGQPTAWLKIGDAIPYTKFKLDKFEFKQAMNEKIKEKEDDSVLTIVNTESSAPLALTVRQPKNVSDDYVLFDYQWPPAAGEIRVKRFQQFALKPETDKNKLYKLIDIRETEAVIQTPDQRDYTVVRDQRQTAK